MSRFFVQDISSIHSDRILNSNKAEELTVKMKLQ